MSMRRTMHRTALGAAAACFVGLVTVAIVGGQAQEAPKPGPEVQRLASMVGTWQDETELHQTPFSPAGKETGTSTCEWFTGNFQVVCRGESTGAAGKTAGMIVVGWHPGRKAYLAQVIESTGMISQLTGSVTGNTWTFTSEGPTPDPKYGKVGRARMTIVDVSPTVQTSKFEISLDGGLGPS
jgi:hypothetical protein